MAKKLQLLGELQDIVVDPSEIERVVNEYLDAHPPVSGGDAVSPTIKVTEIDGGYTLEITDVNGTQTVNIMNGVDGADGAPGKDGVDGAPGKDGVDGTDGAPGKDGVDGVDGAPGEDGISPTIKVTEIDGGYSLEITDINGTNTINIMHGVDGVNGADGAPGKDGADGAPGKDGADGAPGKDGADGYTPVKGVDYFTDEEISEIAKEAAGLVTIDSVDPSKVIFPEGKKTTYAIGKVTLTNGMGELVPPGGNLNDFFNVFMDEQNPSKTDPAVSLTFSQAKAYEVGSKVTPSYSASLSAGSYTYGPVTGVTASKWEVKDTKGNTKDTASGSFPELTVTDGISYKITATATHGAGAVPVTNTGNPYTACQIAAGTKSATSSALTGYRNTFYGTLTAKSDPTSSIIRGLTKSGKALANGSSFTVTIPVKALRVVIAYPATLRDVNSIKDVNGMNAEIKSSFVKSEVTVEGANSYDSIAYKVYVLDFAEANTAANNFTVQI